MGRFFSFLSVRFFFVFLFYCIAVVSVAIIIPNLDQRRIREIPNVERDRIEKRLMRQLSMRNNKNIGRLIVIPKSDDAEFVAYAISSVDNKEYRDFIAAVFDEHKPYQQAIGDTMIMGPFEIRDVNFQFYMLFNKMPPSYYVSQMFSSPMSLLILMMLASLPFIFLLTYSLYKPIHRLKQASERVANGDWEVDPLLESGSVEFNYLGVSFNNMVTALQKAEEEKNRLFGNMSHELRTPLTRIRLTNSMLRRKASADLLMDVDRIEQNLILIEERIQAMLALSRKLILSRNHSEKILLADAILELLAEATFEAEANNKTLIHDDIPEVLLFLNIESFQSGLENILRNAIHYARELIYVNFSLENHRLVITVRDDGSGVSPCDIDRLFEAFYRSENSEVNDSNGAGLGLAIANQMVKNHKGTIVAENNQDGGLKITLSFPIVIKL